MLGDKPMGFRCLRRKWMFPIKSVGRSIRASTKSRKPYRPWPWRTANAMFESHRKRNVRVVQFVTGVGLLKRSGRCRNCKLGLVNCYRARFRKIPIPILSIRIENVRKPRIGTGTFTTKPVFGSFKFLVRTVCSLKLWMDVIFKLERCVYRPAGIRGRGFERSLFSFAINLWHPVVGNMAASPSITLF